MCVTLTTGRPLMAPNHHRNANPARAPLFTIPDVAEILKVSEKQVRRYIADPDPRKRLPSSKFGRLIRIEPSDLENFIRDRDRRRP